MPTMENGTNNVITLQDVLKNIAKQKVMAEYEPSSLTLKMPEFDLLQQANQLFIRQYESDGKGGRIETAESVKNRDIVDKYTFAITSAILKGIEKSTSIPELQKLSDNFASVTFLTGTNREFVQQSIKNTILALQNTSTPDWVDKKFNSIDVPSYRVTNPKGDKYKTYNELQNIFYEQQQLLKRNKVPNDRVEPKYQQWEMYTKEWFSDPENRANAYDAYADLRRRQDNALYNYERYNLYLQNSINEAQKTNDALKKQFDDEKARAEEERAKNASNKNSNEKTTSWTSFALVGLFIILFIVVIVVIIISSISRIATSAASLGGAPRYVFN